MISVSKSSVTEHTSSIKMSLPFSKVMQALVAKTAPEPIYSYKVSPVVKAGSWALSLVFFTYGATYANWSYESSQTVYKEADEATRKDWKFLVKSFAPMGLTVIPLSLAVAAVYVPSRIVTRATYIPRKNGIPECELVRRSAILGRDVSVVRTLTQLTRSGKTRVFTGVGDQGVEDKGSFVFFLSDRSGLARRWFNKVYIFPRSGRFWASDGRVFDALFGGDSIRDLELKTKDYKNGLDSKTLQDVKQDRSMLDELIQQNSTRAKFHSGSKTSDLSKRIVGSQKAKRSQ